MPALVGFPGAGASLQDLPQPKAGCCTFGEGASNIAGGGRKEDVELQGPQKQDATLFSKLGVQAWIWDPLQVPTQHASRVSQEVRRMALNVGTRLLHNHCCTQLRGGTTMRTP